MKQEQTIDDILKLLKNSINDEADGTEEVSNLQKDQEPISEVALKERLQKQYGESSAESTYSMDSYTIDDEFLQEAVLEQENIASTENIEELETLEELEESNETSEELLKIEEVLVSEDLPLAIDYDDEEEEIEYELLPKLYEEVSTELILRDQPTDAVPVEQPWEIVSEEMAEEETPLLEGKEQEPLLSGNTYTTPVLAEGFGSFDEEEASAYDLMRQFGCESEWKSEDLPLTASEAQEDEDTAVSEDDTLTSVFKKKRIALIRLLGGALLSILLFFYETLPLFDISFSGILNYEEYVGAYLLIGFQILFLSALMFGKRMAVGALRIFSLRPDVYSIAALSVLGVLTYDIVAIVTMHGWIAPFHFAVALLLLILAWSEYLLASREMKVLSMIASASEEPTYTLKQLNAEDRLVAKMMRGGLSEEASVSAPERCNSAKKLCLELRECRLGVRAASMLLLPALLLSLVSAIVTVWLNGSLSSTMLTSIAMLLATLPISAILVVAFPLWFSSTRLEKRNIAISGGNSTDLASETGVMIFEDVHLFRKCSTADTGIAFYEKNQTATVLGCLECLYSKLGGPLSEAFSNVPEQYRFALITIRRLTNGGVEALIERKHTLLVGDAAFMKRYGLNFPQTEEKSGRTTIYISLNGKISAKMSVRYQPEPIFEMLVERMAQEGTQCVIKTFDPMISAARVSLLRTMGSSPISVIHQNLSDLGECSATEWQSNEATSVFAVASRFKLIEALCWMKALVRLRRIHQGLMLTLSIVALIAIGVLTGFGKIELINQYWLILWGVLSNLVAWIITIATLPSKKYFSVDTYRAAWEKERARKNKKQKGNK